ncbi:hypothetical protein M942_19445 [Enterobacter ludwigii]|nr:hypothetical protein M942_19445 [Enterobacter ludwigii]
MFLIKEVLVDSNDDDTSGYSRQFSQFEYAP